MARALTRRRSCCKVCALELILLSKSGDWNSSLLPGIIRMTVFSRCVSHEVVMINAVVAAVGIMLVLSLSRVHVVIALIVGAVVGGLVQFDRQPHL